MSNLKIRNIKGKLLSVIFICSFLLKEVAGAESNLVIQNNINDDLSVNLIHPSLVNKLYRYTGNKLIWFLPGENSPLLRQALKNKIENEKTAYNRVGDLTCKR